MYIDVYPMFIDVYGHVVRIPDEQRWTRRWSIYAMNFKLPVKGPGKTQMTWSRCPVTVAACRGAAVRAGLQCGPACQSR